MWESLCNPRLGRESGKAALREEVNEMKSALCLHAGRHDGTWRRLGSVSPGLLWEKNSRTFAPAKNKLCCVKEVHWCCNMMAKRYRQSSEMGPDPVCFMRPNRAAASAEVDHFLSQLVEILFYRVKMLVVGWVQTTWPNTDAVLDRLTNTSVFVNVGMCCDTLSLTESANVRMR